MRAFPKMSNCVLKLTPDLKATVVVVLVLDMRRMLSHAYSVLLCCE